MSDNYPVTESNKVRQIRENAVYDKKTVHSILDSALVASVGFVQDGSSVVVPMIYGRRDSVIYLHGARKARVIRLLEETNRACINVTHIDGIVFARSAFNSSMNYRSATVFGRAELVEDRDRKLEALRIISEHSMPGRWGELRKPLEREIKMTGVIALEIESASAKVATGMPDDEDEDYDIPIWAGVLPINTTADTLQTDDRVLEGVEPSSVVQAMQNKIY